MRLAFGGFVGFLAVLIALGLMLKLSTPVNDLPQGFQRHQFRRIKASFPCPIGWFTRERAETGCIAGYLTQEDTFKEGFFETGLTINFLEEVSESTSVMPSEYVAAYALLGTSEKKVLIPVTETNKNGQRRLTYRLTGDEITIHYLLIANDQQDSLYIVFFESPAREWTTAWKTGETMFAKAEFVFPNEK
jgi:hypothetical protein